MSKSRYRCLGANYRTDICQVWPKVPPTSFFFVFSLRKPATLLLEHDFIPKKAGEGRGGTQTPQTPLPCVGYRLAWPGAPPIFNNARSTLQNFMRMYIERKHKPSTELSAQIERENFQSMPSQLFQPKSGVRTQFPCKRNAPKIPSRLPISAPFLISQHIWTSHCENALFLASNLCEKQDKKKINK